MAHLPTDIADLKKLPFWRSLCAFAKHRHVKRALARLAEEGYEATREEVSALLTTISNLPAADKPQAKERVAVSKIKERDTYVHNEETNTYVFTFAGHSGHVALSCDRVDAMVADYSSAVGRGATVNELARAHDIPRGVIVRVLRAMGVTHDSLPWTPERLAAAESIDELAKEAEQLRQQDIYTRIERDKWRAVERDAQKWRKFNEAVVQQLRSWFAERAPNYAPPVVRLSQARERYTFVVGITDEHWGKLGIDGYNRNVQRAMYLRLIERAMSRLRHLGRPERLIVPIGSDGLHVDTLQGTTTRGTPQHTDGTPADVVRSFMDYKVEQLDALSAWGPLDLWPLPGNHDNLTAILAYEGLRGWFSQRKDVTADRNSLHTIQGELYGRTLVTMHHGDKHNVRHLSEIVPRRFAREWGASRWRYCFTGHYHTERDLPQRSDLQIIRLPSAAGTDRWHYEQGYDGGRRALTVHVISPDRGIVLAVNEPVLEEDVVS